MGATAAEPLLSVKNLSKRFPVGKTFFGKPNKWVHAVNNVSFDIMPGETFSLVGESGCGKSTTSRLINRLITPDEGQIIFDGQDIAKISAKEMRPLRSKMQMVFQDPYGSLNPRMKVQDIIADEPVSALDVSIQAQVLNLLRDVQEQYSLTYLFISHDLAVVEMISDRIGVMYLGTIMEVAPNEELYSNPQHPYTQALLSAVPIPDPTIEKKHVLIEGDLPSPTNIPSGCPFHTRCPHATEKCSAEVPPTKEVKPGHFVNCHYPGREL